MCEIKQKETRYWVKLVISHPVLENCCPWEKLNTSAWHDILLVHPDFMRHAPKMITSSFMTINQWLHVLQRQPELDVYVPAVNTLPIKGSETTGRLWGKLLSCHPQFAKYALWKHLHRKDWITVLSQQPQFIGNYEDEQKQSKGKEYTLNPSDIAHIFACQPTLFEHFKTTVFSSSDWKTILLRQPQFCDKCDFHSRGLPVPNHNWSFLPRQPQSEYGGGYKRLMLFT